MVMGLSSHLLWPVLPTQKVITHISYHFPTTEMITVDLILREGYRVPEH